MFGFKKRHDQILNKLCCLNTKVDKLELTFEEMLYTIKQLIDLQEPLHDVTKELNESVCENGKRLNSMINELKGAVAMSRASLPNREDESLKPKKGKKND